MAEMTEQNPLISAVKALVAFAESLKQKNDPKAAQVNEAVQMLLKALSTQGQAPAAPVAQPAPQAPAQPAVMPKEQFNSRNGVMPKVM